VQGIPDEGLEPLPGCADKALGIQVVKHAHPNSYSVLAKLQWAIFRCKWHHRIHKVVRDVKVIPELRESDKDPETGERHSVSQSRVATACKWFVGRITRYPGRRGV
jgi:hypothetical protein